MVIYRYIVTRRILGGHTFLERSLVTQRSLPPEKSSRFRWFWEELDRYLGHQKLKQTRQRKIICDAILRLNTHVDADELHKDVTHQGHDIGLATIYRTLNLLTEAGLLEMKTFQDGRSLYELREPDGHHDHLICLDCGRVVEFENDQIEKIQQDIARRHGMQLKTHRLDLFGHCQIVECEYRNRKTER